MSPIKNIIISTFSGGFIILLGFFIGFYALHYDADILVKSMGLLLSLLGIVNSFLLMKKSFGDQFLFWELLLVIGGILFINSNNLNYLIIDIYISILLLCSIICIGNSGVSCLTNYNKNKRLMHVGIILCLVAIIELCIFSWGTNSILVDDMRRLVLLTYILLMLGINMIILGVLRRLV